MLFRMLIVLRAGILHEAQRDAADLTHTHMIHSIVVRGLRRRGCRPRRQEGSSPRSFTGDRNCAVNVTGARGGKLAFERIDCRRSASIVKVEQRTR